MIKTITLALALVLLFTFSTKGIDDIRLSFQNASLNQENAIAFNELVKQSTSLEKELKTTYLGASETLLAKFEKTPGGKLRLFKSGVTQIENAIEANPLSVEMRLIRLMIQKNAPPIVKYADKIEKDKEFILTNLHSTSNDVKKFIKRVANDTDIFTSEELTKIK
jgi:hypothetical protein